MPKEKDDLISNYAKLARGEIAQDRIKRITSAEYAIKNDKNETAEYIMNGQKTPAQIEEENKPIQERQLDEQKKINNKLLKLLNRQKFEKINKNKKNKPNTPNHDSDITHHESDITHPDPITDIIPIAEFIAEKIPIGDFNPDNDSYYLINPTQKYKHYVDEESDFQNNLTPEQLSYLSNNNYTRALLYSTNNPFTRKLIDEHVTTSKTNNLITHDEQDKDDSIEQQINDILSKQKTIKPVTKNIFKDDKKSKKGKNTTTDEIYEPQRYQQVTFSNRGGRNKNKNIPRKNSRQHGSGLKKKTGKKPPINLEYGRFLIDSKKLLKNELSLRFRDAINKPRDFPNRVISNQLKRKILSLIEGDDINIDDLPPNEQKFILEFKKVSRTDNVITGGSICCSVMELTHRFDLLSGEIQAGNDSDSVKNELSQVINELVKKNALTVTQAVKYSKAFITDV